ncbi:hypothetical protein B14911_08265 [Bacillus sp. NRRL B-14911]|uniref:Uncharacterized protein n=1 Tax=Bacillus infantis NRRL B-14911 TaxID=1367477 RepID=U5LC66_9BACI|nr:hypothetical protein N288_17780 [Bacillus infantis NRRL B-14911]EAR65231.1 hypothetical protein B14911_08265 [Bacillus sp. NRRL B-14911]
MKKAKKKQAEMCGGRRRARGLLFSFVSSKEKSTKTSQMINVYANKVE